MLLRGPGVVPLPPALPPFSPPLTPPPPTSLPLGAEPLGRPDLLSRATLPTVKAPPTPREAAMHIFTRGSGGEGGGLSVMYLAGSGWVLRDCIYTGII